MNKNALKRLELEMTPQRFVLENGLTVLVVPKPGFSRKIAYFMTNYGSVHTSFTLEGKAYTTPAGVAHYLEHKLFDNPDGSDSFSRFFALGVDSNAYTDYNRTARRFASA